MISNFIFILRFWKSRLKSNIAFYKTQKDYFSCIWLQESARKENIFFQKMCVLIALESWYHR